MRARSVQAGFCSWVAGSVFLLASAGVFAADDPPDSKNCAALSQSNSALAIESVRRAGEDPKVDPKASVSMDDRVWVKIRNLPLHINCKPDGLKSLTLYLNGRPIPKLPGAVTDGGQSIEFHLRRSAESRPQWAELLGSPKPSEWVRSIKVAVGPDAAGTPFAAADTKAGYPVIELTLISNWKAWLAGIGWLVMVGLFIWLARKSGIVRDRNYGGKASAQSPPYSLAKCQMAAWLFVVVTSFLFIYLITVDYNDVLSDQALILIGIATGTTLGAAVIEIGKAGSTDTNRQMLMVEQSDLEAQKASLESEKPALAANPQNTTAIAQNDRDLAATKAKLENNKKNIENLGGTDQPPSKGPLNDLLTDVNGITLHRFQMLVWTIILILLFLFEVYRQLAMPDFDAKLLALIGISAGTYLGFKIPERQP